MLLGACKEYGECTCGLCTKLQPPRGVFQSAGSRGGKAYTPPRRNHCPQGHPYSGDNLYVGSKGENTCRECTRRAETTARKKRQEQRKATSLPEVRTWWDNKPTSFRFGKPRR